MSAAPRPLLAPPPRRLGRGEGSLRLTAVVLRGADGDAAEPAAGRLEEGLAAAGISTRRAPPGSEDRAAEAGSAARSRGAEATIRLRLDPDKAGSVSDEGRESYRLEVCPTGVEIAAAAPPGVYYGVETLLQWLAAHPPAEPGAPAELPAVRIEDRPGLGHRGFLLDVSRNRVPTLDSLLRLVDTMAALKLNQLQLYTEHTFAYRGHEVVWRDASPLAADDMRTLDAHCRRRFVELVPNQNSFGHLHRWLRHEPYRRLAEVPEGLPHPFGGSIEPFSLCPVDPGAIDLLRDLYDQLLPHFTSELFNVGCDETFDLGKGRSAEACRERGTGRVYLEFLRRLHGLAARRCRRIQFWADILASRSELLGEVPGDAVALEWGYEAGHPFDERAAALAGAGLEFYLCPGTSSWNSFAGRLDNALPNLAEAARAAAEHGASGYLITDWGDNGHLQPWPASWPALVAGAAFAWRPEAAADPAALDLPILIDRFAAPHLAAGTGAILTMLGRASRETGVAPMNASALFKLVDFAERSLEGAGLGALTPEGLARAEAMIGAATDKIAALGSSPETTPPATAPSGEAGGVGERRQAGARPLKGAELVERELGWVAAMLRFASRLGGARLTGGGRDSVAALPARRRHALARELGHRIEELTPIWLARSRPGGLQDSRRRLQRVQRLLS